jgi:hypothetical protein
MERGLTKEDHETIQDLGRKMVGLLSTHIGNKRGLCISVRLHMVVSLGDVMIPVTVGAQTDAFPPGTFEEMLDGCEDNRRSHIVDGSPDETFMPIEPRGDA